MLKFPKRRFLFWASLGRRRRRPFSSVKPPGLLSLGDLSIAVLFFRSGAYQLVFSRPEVETRPRRQVALNSEKHLGALRFAWVLEIQVPREGLTVLGGKSISTFPRECRGRQSPRIRRLGRGWGGEKEKRLRDPKRWLQEGKGLTVSCQLDSCFNKYSLVVRGYPSRKVRGGGELICYCLPSSFLVDSTAAWWVQLAHTNVEIETQSGVELCANS